jgi:hypothetical protein
VRQIGILLLVGILLLPGAAIAARQVMTDEEMDAVSASGFTIDLNPADPTKLSFSFDLGGNSGLGDVSISPPTLTVNPSTLLIPGGAVDLTNARFNVENMIFNLNICVQCSGSIFQSGVGIPITFKMSQ